MYFIRIKQNKPARLLEYWFEFYFGLMSESNQTVAVR